MLTLLAKIQAFKKNAFREHQTLFEKLQDGQSPDVLFITCSDSRINPHLLMQSGPGELFVVRNAGNIIPPYSQPSDTAATIEYALTALNIKDIVVCGHSCCGAMKGLLQFKDVAQSMPMVARHLHHAQGVLTMVTKQHPEVSLDCPERLDLAIKANVLVQIEQLKTHPSVAQRLRDNDINIHAWMYQFETGVVHVYDEQTQKFMSTQQAIERVLLTKRDEIIENLGMHYLSQFTSPNTASDYLKVMRLFSHIKYKGVGVIWHDIEKKVSDNFVQAVGGFFKTPHEYDFRALAQEGRHIKLPHLDHFQKQITESPGYHQYCSQRLKHSAWFHPPKVSKQEAFNQHEFDKRYGLVSYYGLP